MENSFSLDAAKEWAKTASEQLGGKEASTLAVVRPVRNIQPVAVQWRDQPIISGFTGTACKCGAHTSAPWERDGEKWLTQHVSEIHPEEIAWKDEIQYALSLPADECFAHLRALVGK